MDHPQGGLVMSATDDRLGDAIRALAAQMDSEGEVKTLRIGVRVHGRVAIFELRQVGATDRWITGPRDQGRYRVGETLCIGPRD
jgi:hypothetical protein